MIDLRAPIVLLPDEADALLAARTPTARQAVLDAIDQRVRNEAATTISDEREASDAASDRLSNAWQK